ncbi:MAG: uncharacterized protein KVP18_001762 [Porospora cf. gigantea A]|uniref:uncharacterized protein n=1 Tax=Porospora cf. gigantea A TaxID=2853593 RepID=UPI00355A97E6|nr:MAG: hypothetical protein KVP18_001762 [Porospora cf. gigantea A]
MGCLASKGQVSIPAIVVTPPDERPAPTVVGTPEHRKERDDSSSGLSAEERARIELAWQNEGYVAAVLPAADELDRAIDEHIANECTREDSGVYTPQPVTALLCPTFCFNPGHRECVDDFEIE